MTPVTRPRGPLPPRVYWFRRGLVLVVALALVWGVAHLLGSGGGTGSEQAARTVVADASSSAPTTAPPASAPPEAVTSPRPPTKKQRRAQATAAATPLTPPEGPCASGDITVDPSVRGNAYAGRSTVFTLSMTSRVSPACTFTVTPSTVVLRLTSGSDRIWSTQECRGAVPKQSVVVRRDVPATVSVAWNGQRSDSDCTRSTAWAQPGYYHVTAAVFGADPTDEQFELQPPPRPTVTATPSPREGASRKPSKSPSKSPSAKPTKKPSKKH
jgi:hypothetical protein